MLTCLEKESLYTVCSYFRKIALLRPVLEEILTENLPISRHFLAQAVARHTGQVTLATGQRSSLIIRELRQARIICPADRSQTYQLYISPELLQQSLTVEMELVNQLRLTAVVYCVLRAGAYAGHNESQLCMLHCFPNGERDDVTIASLSSDLGTSHAALSRDLKAVKTSLLIAEPTPYNRRRYGYSLTAKGQPITTIVSRYLLSIFPLNT